MAKVNKVELEGKMYNPKVITTKTGKKMGIFSINFASRKVNDNWENQYINVKCFDIDIPPAGTLVEITGKLSQEKYTDKQGHERIGFAVIADEVTPLGQSAVPQAPEMDEIAF